ncbi:MAG: Holliday junction branch migration protein RuvA [Bacteroidales bacterium]|jgi:Holliday junction DNA helicase RuvA|nr:Holliday junction branch migration protein RuvA [Bacteroidales bacterium]
MLEYISGTVKKITPTYTIIDNAGIGYCINISLQTCEQLREETPATLLVHEIIREDAHELYGFAQESERALFRLLISVSGVGANTARVILSKLSYGEISQAIASGNVNLIQSVKGIGAKTAQRIIIDLRDKILLTSALEENEPVQSNIIQNEALSALSMLGFAKAAADKVVQKIVNTNPHASVEEIVKQALKQM